MKDNDYFLWDDLVAEIKKTVINWNKLDESIENPNTAVSKLLASIVLFFNNLPDHIHDQVGELMIKSDNLAISNLANVFDVWMSKATKQRRNLDNAH